jgi:serine/threonine-protein kinase
MDIQNSEIPTTGDVSEQKDELRKNRIIADRFRLGRKIGQGGMGHVFLAEDLKNQNAKCAVKLLKGDVMVGASETQRFHNECLIVLNLKHRNLVSVIDVGVDSDEEFYIVMEYVGGGSLGSLLKREGAFTLERALRAMHQIACGLNHSHMNRVVHRDLKPDNVLVAKNEILKIADFGLAKSQNIGESLTRTGETVGTPYYMAPEQFRGEASTPLNDIYSLGIMAYEFVMGARPFEHENYVALATMHLNYPLPNMLESKAEIPKWFQEFIEACTEKKTRFRLQNMFEVADYLEYQMDLLGIKVDERISAKKTVQTGILRRLFAMLKPKKL